MDLFPCDLNLGRFGFFGSPLSTTTCCPGAGVSEDAWPGPPFSQLWAGQGHPALPGPGPGTSCQINCPPPSATASSSSGGQQGRARLFAQHLCGGAGEGNAAAACPPRRRGPGRAVAPPAAARSTITPSATFGGGWKAAGRATGEQDRAAMGQGSLHPARSGTEGAAWARGRARIRWPTSLRHQAGHQPLVGNGGLGFSRRRPDRSSSGPVDVCTNVATTLVGGGQRGTPPARRPRGRAETGIQNAKALARPTTKFAGRSSTACTQRRR